MRTLTSLKSSHTSGEQHSFPNQATQREERRIQMSSMNRSRSRSPSSEGEVSPPEMRSSTFQGRRYPVKKALVLWDYENCPVPRGVTADGVVRNIHTVARMYGFQPLRTHVYNPVHIPIIRERLVDAGATAIDARKKGRKECADRAMIEDMWSWAYDSHDSESTGFVVITADSDFGNVITNLVNRGFSFLVITKTGAREHLHKQADFTVHWHSVLQGVSSLGFAMGPDPNAPSAAAHGFLTTAALRASADDIADTDDEDMESIINAGPIVEREEVLSVISSLADPVTGDTLLSRVGLYVQNKFPTMFQPGLVGRCAKELEQLGLIVKTGPGRVALAKAPDHGNLSRSASGTDVTENLSIAIGNMDLCAAVPVSADELMEELRRQSGGSTTRCFHLGQVGNDLRTAYGKERVPKGRVRELVDKLLAANLIQESPERTHIYLHPDAIDPPAGALV